MFKIASVSAWGSAPDPSVWNLRRSPDSLVIRGFLPSEIAARAFGACNFSDSHVLLLDRGCAPHTLPVNLEALATPLPKSLFSTPHGLKSNSARGADKRPLMGSRPLARVGDLWVLGDGPPKSEVGGRPMHCPPPIFREVVLLDVCERMNIWSKKMVLLRNSFLK